MLNIGGLKFQPVPIKFSLIVEKNLFSKRQGSIFNVLNKNFGHLKDKNIKTRQIFAKELKDEPNTPIGALLLRLKLEGDMRYLSMLNKYGDLNYSKFYIENETDKIIDPKEYKNKAHDLVNAYCFEFYKEPECINYSLFDIENMFYRWLYSE